jgi:inorganic pyrophosphatase
MGAPNHYHDIVIGRPKGSAHPRYPDLIYPVDYGFIPGTVGGDGAEIDVFAGETETGLIGVFLTEDSLRDDREAKLLWNVTEDDVTAIGRLLNTGAMRAALIRRQIPSEFPKPGTLEAFPSHVDCLDGELEDFLGDRYLDGIPQERRLFDDEDDPEW